MESITPKTNATFSLSKLLSIIVTVICLTAFVINAYGSIVNRLDDLEEYKPKEMHEDIMLIKRDISDIKTTLVGKKSLKPPEKQ